MHKYGKEGGGLEISFSYGFGFWLDGDGMEVWEVGGCWMGDGWVVG